MRRMIDVTCPRCGNRTSLEGVDLPTAEEIAAVVHMCPDGVPMQCNTSERLVPGPGERRGPTVGEREELAMRLATSAINN